MKTPTMRGFMEQAEQLAKLAEVKEAWGGTALNLGAHALGGAIAGGGLLQKAAALEEMKEKARETADALYPWKPPSFKEDSTGVLMAKALRDAAVIAGSASAGYFGAGALDYPIRHHTPIPDWWRALPDPTKIKILRTAGGVGGIGLAATYLATRAMHGKARYNERNPD